MALVSELSAPISQPAQPSFSPVDQKFLPLNGCGAEPIFGCGELAPEAYGADYGSFTEPLPDPAVQKDISCVFSQLRPFLNLSLAQLAEHLQTDIHTLLALEAGELHALPQWPETQRVIQGYLALVGVDATPVLRAIKPLMRKATPVALDGPVGLQERLGRLEKTAFADLELSLADLQKDLHGFTEDSLMNSDEELLALPSLSENVNGPTFLSKAQIESSHQSGAKAKAWRVSSKVFLTCLALFSALCLSPATSQWTMVANSMPPTVSGFMLNVQNSLLLGFAAQEEGLPLIDVVGDPRARKGDKLQSVSQ